ncbi:LysM peptidoglycan-binding domain-containing protein [Pseudoalteromonas sp. C2R02]|uniref:LysM peptidoglycan-binding domain-containing protein n=1 Tax=Pseudoalteromonas sp. C2R02 TaxID=2841565 RepID=UPI001C08BBD6|nr:LysM peptidoglycan-binding domain-containing protein [Pseudoalteromonas sp. C2R02]MBU2970629.1 LysM peptidoglycan-binding domain-containing protein [Pseudoalteromonas sp. C2R02]
MNKPHIIGFAALMLAGCQITDTDNSQLIQVQQPAKHATAQPNDVVDALTLLALQGDNSAEVELEPTPIFDDVWERINYQLSIPVPQNRAVVTERNYYAKHQRYLDRISTRGAPYLYYIVEEVEKRQMPIELALLPIVESAFDPFGYSHRSASGIWQFMPVTGERFDLKQNWWYDGRRDIVQSTRAALDYLSYLHKTLEGDWLNAIAAYNSGEGRVSRAIKKNRKKHLPTDFWSLDLPAETTAYVPKLLALADLLKNQKEFNVTWKKIVNAQVIDSVDIGSQIDLALAAQMADINITELYRLNPAFNRWATDPDGPHSLLLPIDKIEGFTKSLAKTSLKDRIRWQRYQVQKGDSLSVIANKFSTSTDSIKTLNKLDSNMIRLGQQLFVPLSNGQIDNKNLSRQMKLASKGSAKKTQEKSTYIVRKGDTLWDISHSQGVTIQQLSKWNKLKTSAMIKPGQKLLVYKNKTPKSGLKTVNRTITYKVRSGDSLARIANKFNVSISEIIKWNKISKNKYLQPGQKLKLLVDVKKT